MTTHERISAIYEYLENIDKKEPSSKTVIQAKELTALIEKIPESEQNQFEKPQLTALNTIGVDYFNRGEHALAMEYYQQAMDLADRCDNREYRMRTGINIANIYYRQGNFARALELYIQAKQLISDTEDAELQANLILNIANVEADMGNFSEALAGYDRALNIYQSLGNALSVARTLQNIGALHIDRDEFVLAIQYLEQALEIRLRENDSRGIAICQFHLGNLHNKQSNFKESILYYQKSLQQYSELADKRGTALCLQGLGSVFSELGEYKDALQYFHQSLQLYEQLKMAMNIVEITLNIAILYGKEGKIQEQLELLNYLGENKTTEQFPLIHLSYVVHLALWNYHHGNDEETAKVQLQNAMILAEKRDDADAVAEVQRALAQLYSNSESKYYNPELAENLMEKSTIAFEQSGALAHLAANYEILGELYEKSQRWELAYSMTKKWKVIQQQIYSKETYKQKSQFQLQLLEKEREIDQLRNQELADALEEVNMLNESLTERNHELERLNQDKNELLDIVAHDLKNPIAGIKTMVSALRRFKEKYSESEVELQLIQVENAAGRMTDIVNKVLDVNAIESGNISVDIHQVELSHVCSEVRESFSVQMHQKNIDCIFSIPNNIHCMADRIYLRQILDNIFSNAVKYSLLHSTIEFFAATKGDVVFISCKNYGQGISETDRLRLFQKYARLSATPTGNEHSTGLGLNIAQRLAKLMRGEITCESNDSYTIFTLQLPSAYDANI